MNKSLFIIQLVHDIVLVDFVLTLPQFLALGLNH